MKKIIGLAVLATVLAAPSAFANCGKCGMGEEKGAAGKGHHEHGKGHDCKGGMCPHKMGGCVASIEGAEISVVNNADGAVITVKGKGDAVKKIQEVAAKMAAKECCGGMKDAKKADKK